MKINLTIANDVEVIRDFRGDEHHRVQHHLGDIVASGPPALLAALLSAAGDYIAVDAVEEVDR